MPGNCYEWMLQLLQNHTCIPNRSTYAKDAWQKVTKDMNKNYIKRICRLVRRIFYYLKHVQAILHWKWWRTFTHHSLKQKKNSHRSVGRSNSKLPQRAVESTVAVLSSLTVAHVGSPEQRDRRRSCKLSPLQSAPTSRQCILNKQTWMRIQHVKVYRTRFGKRVLLWIKPSQPCWFLCGVPSVVSVNKSIHSQKC